MQSVSLADRTGQALPGSIRYERRGTAAWLVIDNPAARNALTASMLEDISRLVDEAAADQRIRSVVITGRGPCFSAGADIHNVLDILTGDGTEPDGGLLTIAAQSLLDCPKPTIAVLEGPCMGGAWMLAAACDMRIGSEAAVIGLTPVKLGILYPYAGIVRLVRLAGEGTASDLLLTGRSVKAEEALRLGLLTGLVPDAAAAAEAQCAALARLSQLSVRGHKELIRLAAAGPAEAAAVPGAAQHWYREMVESGDAQEGIRAFFAREQPRFGTTDLAAASGRISY